MAGGLLQSAIEQLFKIIFMPSLNKLAKEMDNDKEFQADMKAAREVMNNIDDIVSNHCKMYPNSPACLERARLAKLKKQKASYPYNK